MTHLAMTAHCYNIIGCPLVTVNNSARCCVCLDNGQQGSCFMLVHRPAACHLTAGACDVSTKTNTHTSFWLAMPQWYCVLKQEEANYEVHYV